MNDFSQNPFHGLVCSLGGWSEVLSMGRDGKQLLTDQRILGREILWREFLRHQSKGTSNG